jgi:hypothetical protein
MGTTIVLVCNRALGKLGAARITAIDEDTRQGRALNSCFEHVRDVVLRSYRWAFALKRTTLAAAVNVPPFQYAYAYALPPDFLQTDLVNNQFPTVGQDAYVGEELLDYAFEGGMLLSNFPPPLPLRYVAQITDASLWDIHFAEVLACKLACELCEEITQSDAKRQLATAELRQAVNLALKANAIMRAPVRLQDNEWLLSRL